MEEYVENENVVAIRFADNIEFELPMVLRQIWWYFFYCE